MVIIICKYLNKKGIDELIKKHYVKEIRLTNEAENTLFEIIENYNIAFSIKIVKHSNTDKVFVILILASYVKQRFTTDSKNVIEQILIVINDMKKLTK